MKSKHLPLLLFLSFFSGFYSCKSKPAVSGPPISFEKYKIADGFEIQVAASEPLIEAPVAMDFDNRGRIWVVEMRGFMQDLTGKDENKHNGRITILENPDKNGRFTKSKVFLDSLVLPRAIAHVYGGLLYAVPPDLWFVEINNDKPGKKTLVDSVYAAGGSVEGQANGLMMGIDNWIYNANSHFRYRLKDGKWLKEPTSFRGQFGITKDNFGRLYYNYNSVNIAGDYALPNSMIGNPYMAPKATVNVMLTDDQRVYPLHSTIVNRGSEEGTLNKDSLLIAFTAACGPLVYRGDQFPKSYDQNAFVCEPQANLIKRNILTFDGVKVSAKQAWNDREFLASTDEGFRPVNLSDGPDGAMYVVDMHRGIMEYGAFITPYYRQGILSRQLDTLLLKGRILRIVNKNKRLDKMPDLLNTKAADWVALLKSSNGWIRDRVQQKLIFEKEQSAVPMLEQLALDSDNPIPAIHALHTLEGLNSLTFDFLRKVAAAGVPMVTAHSLLLLENYNSKDHEIAMKELADALMKKKDPVIDFYLAACLGPWAKMSKEDFLPMLFELSRRYTNQAVYQEAAVSSLGGLEKDFQVVAQKAGANPSSEEVVDKLLAETMEKEKEGKMNSIFVKAPVMKNARANGLAIFQSLCATCHGNDGSGIEHLAPPLEGSEYVNGSTERLAMIILNGLKGPVTVNGKEYHFSNSMPNFGNNYSDKDIVDIIQYLRNVFVPNTTFSDLNKLISIERVKELREKNTGTLTEKDLKNMKGL